MVTMVDVKICGIPNKIPKASYDWVCHLANCSYCYRYNRHTNTSNGLCNIGEELQRKLDEYNAKAKV